MGRTLLAAFAIAVTALATPVQAQDYPSRLIKIIQGFPPGGNIDTIARLVANEMQNGFGQSIIVEARPGAAGAIAAEQIAKADPDGYNLLVLASAHAAHGAFSENVRYDVVNDFQWISTASFYPFLIAVRADSRFKSLDQLLEEAKANPGKITYGSAGIGSILHSTVELLAHQTKTKFLHVPYRGEAPAITSLMGGEFDFIAATTGPITPLIKAGKLRALAVTGAERWPDLPDVPTVDELGVKGFEVVSWTGLAGPKGLPKNVVERLNKEMQRVVKVPAVADRLRAMGGVPTASTPEDMRALVERQYKMWSQLAKDADIRIK